MLESDTGSALHRLVDNRSLWRARENKVKKDGGREADGLHLPAFGQCQMWPDSYSRGGLLVQRLSSHLMG